MLDHSMIMKKICSYDRKLREYIIGLISNNNEINEVSEENKSFCNESSNVFDEIENKWKTIYDETLLLQTVPILLQGSSMEGSSLARLANPFLKSIFEFEIDLNIVIGTVSQVQFESCYEPVDRNKAFFHYVIKNSLANDINLCIKLPEDIEQKLIASISNSSDPLQDKKYLSSIVFKEFFHNSQPTTKNPLKTISVKGIKGIFSETLIKKIEGCSAFLKFSTENLSKDNVIMSLIELVNLNKKQIYNLNRKFDEFEEINCNTVKNLIQCLNEVNRLQIILMKRKCSFTDSCDQSFLNNGVSITKKDNQSESMSSMITNEYSFSYEDENISKCKNNLSFQIASISNTINEWVKCLTILMELHNDIYKFCLDMKSILPQHFVTFFKNGSYLIPDYYYKVFFEKFIQTWSHNKSNMEEILLMASSICHASTIGLSNITALKKTFSELIEPELNLAISLIEESLFLSKNDFISTEILIDNVPCFYAPFWPDAASSWITRNRFWPNSQLVALICRKGFHIVPKSLPEGDERLEWRLSFSAAESVLSLHRTEKQNYIYFLFKSLFYQYVKTYSHEKSLPTYICKTVMMWACEQQLQSWWEEVSPENGVLFLIKELVKGIKKKVIKHYFIEELNLLEHFSFPILIFTELNLFSLEKNFVVKLNALIVKMNAGMNIVQAYLNEKHTTSFDLSVPFVYEQNCLTKLKFLFISSIKIFIYSYFYKCFCIYDEISGTKAELTIQAQVVDLITKVLQFQDNEELRELHLTQLKKFNELVCRITALDKTASFFFSGLKSLVLLSCTKCDLCSIDIRCNTKRYSCSLCTPVGGFDVCIDCINNRKDILQWVHIYQDQPDDNKPNVNLEDTLDIASDESLDLNHTINKQTNNVAEQKNKDCLFSDLFSHTKNIKIIIPQFDIEKFNNFSETPSYETKLGLAFQNLNQQYQDRTNIIVKEAKDMSSVYESEPVSFIENICTQFIYKFENNVIQKPVSILSRCNFGNEIHELYLKDCDSPRCASMFYDPPSDLSYWKSILVLKNYCANNYYKTAIKCVPLKRIISLRHESPGEVIRTTDFFNNLVLGNVNTFDINSKSFEKERSTEILSDATEMLDKKFSQFIESLRIEEKLILNLIWLIQIIEHIEP
ncbi:uncharacterized protein LOC101240287 isoform X2 [Hydra vulgaris]|uniref:uncharacterized protein LOC101240287 isoform X2 n=1 Tax=Hydra vulgaris TaxID=6087 RepID=UPI001F5EA4EE|nr:uncharacterized protein LOC101240287 isoform X1 [Hydra vulgaris]